MYNSGHQSDTPRGAAVAPTGSGRTSSLTFLNESASVRLTGVFAGLRVACCVQENDPVHDLHRVRGGRVHNKVILGALVRSVRARTMVDAPSHQAIAKGAASAGRLKAQTVAPKPPALLRTGELLRSARVPNGSPWRNRLPSARA